MSKRVWFHAVFVLGLCSVGVRDVSAQAADTGRVFAEGALFAGFENRSGSVSSIRDSSSDEADGPVLGWAAGVGTFLTSRVSLRLEVAVPGKIDSRGDGGYPVPLYTVTPTMLTSGSAGVGVPTELAIYPTPEITSERQTTAAAVLLGYHTGRQHGVRLAYLAGVALVQEESEFALEIATPIISFGVPIVPSRTARYEYETTFYRTALALGLDADMSVNAHLSLVPQVRVLAYTGALSVRPGIAVRWTF